MKAARCCHHARYRRPGPGRGDHPRLQRTTISTAHREQQHCDTRLGVHLQLHRPRESAAESAVTPGMPAAALRHQGNSLTPMRAAVVPTSPAGCTAGGTAWDPGNIISDAVFYNSSSMTTAQIRDFITTKGTNCTTAWCLKSLRTTVPPQPADQYCTAIPGGADLDAATVISTVTQACGINPQVMLVTLQKESRLLDRTDPTESTYNAAWGWHCPDTGPGGSANCDPAYAGFFNQGYGMAKQWSRYRVDPDKYNYQAGQTVDILWNVAESGCGGAPVTIANQATAALYNYTPYQPNAASLAAYPGEGDSCSSYGNRNFFYMFNKDFGSTGGGKNTEATGSGAVVPTARTSPSRTTPT